MAATVFLSQRLELHRGDALAAVEASRADRAAVEGDKRGLEELLAGERRDAGGAVLRTPVHDERVARKLTVRLFSGDSESLIRPLSRRFE